VAAASSESWEGFRSQKRAVWSLDEYRKRMLEETSRFIEWGLRHPDLVVWIPVKPTDQGGFPPGVGSWFWGTVLSTRVDGALRRWRDRLLRRPRISLRRR